MLADRDREAIAGACESVSAMQSSYAKRKRKKASTDSSPTSRSGVVLTCTTHQFVRR